MTGKGLNHYVPRRELQEALITGGSITAHCGVTFTPGLRVGSGGRADEPSLMLCAMCDLIMNGFTAKNTITKEVHA